MSSQVEDVGEGQHDDHMSDAGGDQQPTAEELAVQLASEQAARAAAEAEASALRAAASTPAPKGVVNSPKPYSGKKGQTWAEWWTKFVLWAGAVGLLQSQIAPVLLTYIEGAAMQHLTLALGTALAATTAEQINAVLSAATLGSNPTDHSVRKRMFGLKLKRLPTGRFDFEAYFAALKQLMLQAPHPIDVFTVIYTIMQALPDAIAQHVATDPTTGKPWQCVDMFMRHILTCADTLYRLLPAVTLPTDGSRDKKRLRSDATPSFGAPDNRGQKGNGNDKNHDRHKNKLSFVPGKTPAQINEARKSGACFKCGKPGHKAVDCKSTK